MVSSMLWLLYTQGKSPLYPVDRRLGESQRQSGHGSEENNSQSVGNRTLLVQHIA
jgi:hypothetical protein